MSTSIQALFQGADRKIRRSYRIHINDNGYPLCRCRNRIEFSPSTTDKWVVVRDDPTCTVCIRMEKRQKTVCAKKP